jgi:prepilin-type N-terminal cleavage/methylation domain-containing protein
MDRKRANGFTLVELMFVTGIISVLAALATPGLTRARAAANEASAIASLRVINSAQQTFWGTCGSGYFSPTLQNLGVGVAGAQGFLGAELSGPAPVVKSGYEFDVDSSNPIAGTSCNGGSRVVTYHATADPLPGRGSRYFGLNTGGGIFQSSETLFSNMPDSGAPPAPAVAVSR